MGMTAHRQSKVAPIAGVIGRLAAVFGLLG
jgi:hypothetical protein